MGARSNLDKVLAEVLRKDEERRVVTFAQLKQGSGLKRIVKDFGVSLVASAATSAVGLSVMRNTMPALVWVVITDGRLLLIERPATGSRVGEIVFQASPSAVRAIDQSRLRGRLELADAEHGDTIAVFNFGLRKGAAREVLAALG
jgi:hypothetical protein